MKVIDLLNKIANGKKVPVKIKFRNDIFRYTGCSYYCDEMHTTLFNIYSFSILNEEVEVIENEKIEKIKQIDFEGMYLDGQVYELKKLIDKIIDKINKMEDK